MPDLTLPFLGIHSVITIDRYIYYSLPAILALVRENYRGLGDINYQDIKTVLRATIEKYTLGKEFRTHPYKELMLLWHRNFHLAVKSLMPNIKSGSLHKSSKVEIRPQLYNKKLQMLEMDFLMEEITILIMC